MKAMIKSFPKINLINIDDSISKNYDKQPAVLAKADTAKKMLSETSNLHILDAVKHKRT